MRPPTFAGGNAGARGAGSGQRPCFNEAADFCRRKPTHQSTTISMMSSFNEAADFCRRKRGGRRYRDGRGDDRFNEAADFCRRKLPVPGDTTVMPLVTLQ